MTITEVSSNGNGRLPTGVRVRQVWVETGGNITAAEMGDRLGIPERTASYHMAKIRKAASNPEGDGAAVSATPPPAPSATAKPAVRQSPATKGSKTARRPAARRQRDPWKVVGTWVVLAVTLAVSYSHIVHLALLAGGGWWAWVMPLPLDGMALVSLRHLARERHYPVAWAGVLVGAAGSLTANVLAVDPTLVDMRYVLWGFAALPPIAVVVCGHLLDRGGR